MGPVVDGKWRTKQTSKKDVFFWKKTFCLEENLRFFCLKKTFFGAKPKDFFERHELFCSLFMVFFNNDDNCCVFV